MSLGSNSWPSTATSSQGWLARTDASSFPRVDDYRSPQAGQAAPQQYHFGLGLGDLEEAVHHLLELGAAEPAFQPGRAFITGVAAGHQQRKIALPIGSNCNAASSGSE